MFVSSLRIIFSHMADKIIVRGAKVHNLKNIDVDIPLGKIVSIAGVSGSGKSSLALGILYAEGSRRYLESLSTYTRRRMTQAERAWVDEVLYIPASLALRQRPGVPNIRSTFGTSSELNNSLRLMFSRLASHRCPNGHYHEPSLDVAAEKELICPVCGVHFYPPGAEDLAFNSRGACKCCDGTGTVRKVNRSSLIADETLSIEEGAVLPWKSLMWSLMVDVCRAMGVRTDIPFKDLTEKEKEIVYDGPAEKKHILYRAKNSSDVAELDFTYFSAVRTVENAFSKVKDESGMKRVGRFLIEEPCPECHGSRLSKDALYPRIGGMSLADVTAMTLSDAISWVRAMPSTLPDEMKRMGENIAESFLDNAKRLIDLGLGYLTLDRASSTLSTGERQRVQLARAVRNRTTGVLYVLDEPSIGLHPENMIGLTGVMKDLVGDGNSVILVDHDTKVLGASDYMIEMGPLAGKEGGKVIASGTLDEIKGNPDSKIAPFLKDDTWRIYRKRAKFEELFENGSINLKTDMIHTVHPLEVAFPKGRMTVVTGVSGSGKTTLVLESLAPALDAFSKGEKPPFPVKEINAEGIKHVKLIDASPIGVNIRSTVATYIGVHDEMRKLFSRLSLSKEKGYKAGDFSYNTGKLRCPTCDGCGTISLDIQFLPDVEIPCPDCRGSRYGKDILDVKYEGNDKNAYSLNELMDMDVNSALRVLSREKTIANRLQRLKDLGLGYLTLGEGTPGLSGGEAQRLKLASELGQNQSDSVFIFDEPTIGLHPLDVENLLSVFQTLLDQGATIVVIEHDLDVIRNADYVIDMGPGGGVEGGRIIATGTPEAIKRNAESITGKFL